MKKVLFLLSLFVAVVACSDESIVQDEINSANIEQQFIEQLDFLTTENSMLVTPVNHSIQQSILFSPKGKENSLLSSLGFVINQDNLAKRDPGDEKTNLSKMGAAREVGRITDAGGCAQVRKQSNGKYAVKEIKCQ